MEKIETCKNNSLSDIFLLSINKEAQRDIKINLYSLIYKFTAKDNNISINLPGNMCSEIKSVYFNELSQFANCTCTRFDPEIAVSDTYENLPFENIADTWNDMFELFTNRGKDFKDTESKQNMSYVNLNICELNYNGFDYYFGARQNPSYSFLKGKKVFLSTNDEIVKPLNGNLFLMSFNIDFIVKINHVNKENSEFFIFNRDNFFKVFNYDEHLKAKAMKNLSIVETWTFFDSIDLISTNIEKKSVYRTLAKVFDEPEYLNQIKNTKASDLKRRLIARTDSKFTEDDFNGNKIKLKNENLGKVMKMLHKGFRYNFFTDKAEEG